MTDEFYPQLAAKGKQVVLHASEDLTVFGDADKLARVFNNILKTPLHTARTTALLTLRRTYPKMWYPSFSRTTETSRKINLLPYLNSFTDWMMPVLLIRAARDLDWRLQKKSLFNMADRFTRKVMITLRFYGRTSSLLRLG